MGLVHSPKTVTANLILYIDAANFRSYPGSGAVINNLVNVSSQFTLTNGAFFAANNRGVITLDGVNDCIILNSNTLSNNLDSLTVSVWVYKDWANTPNYAPIISKQINYLNGGGWDMSIASNKRVSWSVQEEGGTKYRNFLTPVLSDLTRRWYNFTGSYNGVNAYTNYKIYVNGNLPDVAYVNNSGGGPINTSNSNANLCIGARNAGTAPSDFGDRYFPGDIAVVQIYDRQLSDDEVEQNFNSLRGRFGI